MQRISFWHLAFGLFGAAVLTAACGDPFGQTATVENTVDTVTLHALRNTSIRLPSGFDMLQPTAATRAVRTEMPGSQFDFAFDIDSTGNGLIYPAGALGLSREPGLQLMNRSFPDVRRAPDDGYRADSAITVKPGTVFVARSRITSLLCVYVAVPRYGKFHVLALDTASRSITLETLVDLNCGFRGLEPGIPGS